MLTHEEVSCVSNLDSHDIGSFRVKGKIGTSDVSVVRLSGEAGGDLGNVNRWRGQINLEPISEPDLPKHMQVFAAGWRHMHFVNFASRELLVDSRYKKRINIMTGPRPGSSK